MNLDKKVIVKATGEVGYLESEYTVEGTKFFGLFNDSHAYEESELLFIKSETEGTEKKSFEDDKKVELPPSEENSEESEHGNDVDDQQVVLSEDEQQKYGADEKFDVAKCDYIEVLKEQFRHSFNKTKSYTEYCHEILLRIDELAHEH